MTRPSILKALSQREMTGRPLPRQVLQQDYLQPLPERAAIPIQNINWDDEIEQMIVRFEERTGLSRYPDPGPPQEPPPEL